MRGLILLCALSVSQLFSLEEKPAEMLAARLILRENDEAEFPYAIRYENNNYVVYPHVFSPKYFPDTYWFANHLPFYPDETFLEIGSGTGLIAVTAALKGASLVTAIDINEDAVKNTTENAFNLEVAHKMRIYEGDLFEPLSRGEKFDTIFWFVPFMHIDNDPSNLTGLERAIFDPYYRGIKRYIREGREYLNPNGRLLLGFCSSHGDLDFVQHIAKENGLRIEVLAREEDKAMPTFPGMEPADPFKVMLLSLVSNEPEASPEAPIPTPIPRATPMPPNIPQKHLLLQRQVLPPPPPVFMVPPKPVSIRPVPVPPKKPEPVSDRSSTKKQKGSLHL